MIIVTHTCLGQNMRAALAAIDGLNVVGAKTVSYRIEDFTI